MTTQEKRSWEKFFDTREEAFLRWKYMNRPKSDGVPLYEVLAKLITGTRVLDVGCASCIMYPFLPDKQYVGLDYTQKFLDHAVKLYPEIQVHHGTVLDLPFEDCSFDTVFCKSLLEHIHPDEWSMAVNEMLRVSSKQLILGFFRPPGDALRWYQRGKNEVYVTYKKGDLMGILKDYSRFRGVEVTNYREALRLATYDIALSPCDL